jgi:hypothetical protein
MAGSHTWRQVASSNLSCIFRSFVLSSARPPTLLYWQSSCCGRGWEHVCESGLWTFVANRRVDWEWLQATRWAHAHLCIQPPGVCMRRLLTVVRRPNLHHQTQLAVERASQHPSRSPADSTMLLPRRGHFWLAHLRLASGSSSACLPVKPVTLHLAVKATTTH